MQVRPKPITIQIQNPKFSPSQLKATKTLVGLETLNFGPFIFGRGVRVALLEGDQGAEVQLGTTR